MNISKQKGITTLDLLGVLLLVCLVWEHYIYTPSQAYLYTSQIRNNPPPVTIVEYNVIEQHKAKPAPNIDALGIYSGSGVHNGNDIKATYYFADDQTLVKELTYVGKYTLAGAAKYSLEGSVLSYSDIIGDKKIFSEAGEVIVEVGNGMLELPLAGFPLTLKKRDYDPDKLVLNKEPRSKSYLDIIRSIPKDYFIFILVGCLAIMSLLERKPKKTSATRRALQADGDKKRPDVQKT